MMEKDIVWEIDYICNADTYEYKTVNMSRMEDACNLLKKYADKIRQGCAERAVEWLRAGIDPLNENDEQEVNMMLETYDDLRSAVIGKGE
jgi:hypothetical protein